MAPEVSPGREEMACDGMMTFVCGVLAGDVAEAEVAGLEAVAMAALGELLTRTD